MVPCYNDEENITEFYKVVTKILKKVNNYRFEIIYVLDPAKDNSFDVVRQLHQKDEIVKYIFMANRYGKEPSMLAGLEAAKGDYVAVMDVDLQDPPELLPEMISIMETGEYDAVGTRRIDRKGEPFIRSIFSNLFYKLFYHLSKLDVQNGARDFRIMSRKVVDSVLKSKEKNRFLKAIYGFTGFKIKWLDFKNVPRKYSKTKWSFFKLFDYALICLFGFTKLPIVIIGLVGLICLLIAIIMLIIGIFIGFSSTYLIINMIILFTGIQIFCLSILSYYLYSIYAETKDKPLYIIYETSEKKD